MSVYVLLPGYFISISPDFKNEYFARGMMNRETQMNYADLECAPDCISDIISLTR
jgi:hypothetical protein